MTFLVPVGRRVALSVLAGAALLTGASGAAAQTYPASTVRIIVGFGPGSTADILARLVAKHMETSFGQPVLVENRLGNSSMTAAQIVSRAPKDGYTLFMATVANTLNPVQTGLAFNLGTDLEPIALLGVNPNVLVVHPSVPAKSVKELIAIAKTKPDSLTFGTSGAGTASHLAAELFNARAGTKILSVHYQGGANQGMSDLLTGRITAMFNVAAALAPHANSGKLVPLAVAQPKRAGIMPNVPTMDEEGIPGFDVGIWIGLLAPAGTPAPVVEKLSLAANDALKSEAVMAVLTTQGIDPVGTTPQEFNTFIRADIDKWKSIIAMMNAQK